MLWWSDVLRRGVCLSRAYVVPRSALGIGRAEVGLSGKLATLHDASATERALSPGAGTPFPQSAEKKQGVLLCCTGHRASSVSLSPHDRIE